MILAARFDERLYAKHAKHAKDGCLPRREDDDDFQPGAAPTTALAPANRGGVTTYKTGPAGHRVTAGGQVVEQAMEHPTAPTVTGKPSSPC